MRNYIDIEDVKKLKIVNDRLNEKFSMLYLGYEDSIFLEYRISVIFEIDDSSALSEYIYLEIDVPCCNKDTLSDDQINTLIDFVKFEFSDSDILYANESVDFNDGCFRMS